MIQFIAHSDGKVIVPDEQVELPRDQAFCVTAELAENSGSGQLSAKNWFEKALDISRQMANDLPEDLAEQHDHYIHGSLFRRS